VFKSKNGTHITWTDDFYSEILNFTGKHRCSWNEPPISTDDDNIAGKIVVSTGVYKNLDDDAKIDIDDAIPIVELCSTEYDVRAFGVVNGFEPEDGMRTYKIGNMRFSKTKANKDCKVIVNAVGEGAIWVTNVNGTFKNGDLITTSAIKGYGMKQKGQSIKSYTIGKITCDCNFTLDSTVYKCEEFAMYGRVYRRALVGCIYKF
jgi:hypothetical protein